MLSDGIQFSNLLASCDDCTHHFDSTRTGPEPVLEEQTHATQPSCATRLNDRRFVFRVATPQFKCLTINRQVASYKEAVENDLDD